MPAVSILLPIRNAAPTLTACLDSIARQGMDDYEILAIDDASTDATAAILHERRASEPRLRILTNPRPGLVNALNLGLTEARAPLIARMDADDRMRAARLQRQCAWMARHPDISVVGSRVELFPEADIHNGMRHYVNWLNQCLTSQQIHQDIYLESPLAHPSVMFRRDAVRAAGGYRNGAFPEDYELWLRMHRQGHRFGKLDSILLDWRDHPARASRCDPRCARSAFDRVRAAYLKDDPALHQSRTLAIWGAGRKTRRRTRPLLDAGIRPQAWIDIDARKIGGQLDGVGVHPPEWLPDRPVKPFVLIYVASHGAREEIAHWLQSRDFRPGRDFYQVG